MDSPQKNNIAIVDICDTLFASNTTFDFLNYYLKDDKRYRRFAQRRKNRIIRVYNSIVFRLFHQDIIRKRAIRFLARRSQSDLKQAAEAFYNEVLREKMRSEIADLLQEFRGRGIEIMLVSATLDFIAEVIKEKLQADRFLSTRLAYHDGICLGRIDRDLLGYKDKLLEEEGVALHRAKVVTDNISDKRLVSKAQAAYIIAKPKQVRSWASFQNIVKIFVVE